jgi:O-antigen chain-terminating methyltransferase
MLKVNHPDISEEKIKELVQCEMQRIQNGPARWPQTDLQRRRADTKGDKGLEYTTYRDGREFQCQDFNDLSTEQFLIAAYAAIMKRSPDPQGYEHFFSQLAHGDMTRPGVLGRLRFSAEGRRHKMRIKGVLWRYILDKITSLPVVGWMVSFFECIIRLPELLRKIRALEEGHGQRLFKNESVLNQHGQVLESIEPEVYRLGLAQDRSTEQDIPEFVYLALENQFRGEREDLQSKLEKYLPLIQDVLPLGGHILDLGSGRGEWLELLGREGISAQGVDLSKTMVQLCQEQGLEVTWADALDHLSGLHADSLPAVTAFQLMEHLPPPVLVRLWQEAFRVLKPGGLILFETPNPENVQVSTYSFYLDPTHRKPVPPPLATYTMHALGFRDIKVIRNSEFIDPIFEDPRLNNFFCSAMDYAVIGYKEGWGGYDGEED